MYCFLDKIGYLLVSIALLLKTWRLYQIKSNKLLKVKVCRIDYGAVNCLFANRLQIRFISSKAMFIFTLILLVPVGFLLLIQLIIDRPRLNTELIDIEVKIKIGK